MNGKKLIEKNNNLVIEISYLKGVRDGYEIRMATEIKKVLGNDDYQKYNIKLKERLWKVKIWKII